MADYSPLGRLTRRAALAGLAAGTAQAFLPAVARAARDDDELTQNIAVEVTARPIPAFGSVAEEMRFGGLEYRGGVSLYGNSKHFGGLSGLVVEPDGRGLLAVTDVGNWLAAEITYDGTKPTGLKGARMGALRDEANQPLRDKKYQDAESITLLDGSLQQGRVLVGFERQHRIVPYQVANGMITGGAGLELKPPADVRKIPKNQGFEAVARLKGGPHAGAVIAFAERYTRGSGYHSGWLWLDGEPQKLQLKDIDTFDITDAAGLDNGDLLVLERRFRWTEGVQMRLRRLAAREIKPGAKITGETLLAVNGDYQIDNMEGLAVHRDASGQTVVTLISDDNFNRFLQRTLLLQFTLLDKAGSTVRT
jgi:hypothetical protein